MQFKLGFPTGRDSANFWDKGTEVSSLSQDKGTMGQAQNLGTGRAGPEQPIKTMHSGRKGIFDYFQFCFLVARSMHLNITRYMRSNKVEIVQFQGRKMNF